MKNPSSDIIQKTTKNYKSISLNKNKPKSYSNSISPNLTKNSQDNYPPNIKIIYDNLCFNEFQPPIQRGRVNFVYQLQQQINNHLKASLDFKINKEVEEDFESDELSEGIERDFAINNVKN